MKLHQDNSSALNAITAYGTDYVEVNNERYTSSIIVLPDAAVCQWPVTSFSTLSSEHFAQIIAYAAEKSAAGACEVVIFGSGHQLRFPPASVIAPLMAQRIGIETMDFHAACRTYNILMAEGRRVAVALLLEDELNNK